MEQSRRLEAELYGAAVLGGDAPEVGAAEIRPHGRVVRVLFDAGADARHRRVLVRVERRRDAEPAVLQPITAILHRSSTTVTLGPLYIFKRQKTTQEWSHLIHQI